MKARILPVFILFFTNFSQAQMSHLPPNELPIGREVIPVSQNKPHFPLEISKGFCTELITDEVYPERNYSAIHPIPKIKEDGTLSTVAVTRQKLAWETNKMWDPGQILLVYIDQNNSTKEQRELIIKHAKKWEEIANIKFQEVTDKKSAQIKIGFKNSGNWSALGKDALGLGKYEYTMNIEKKLLSQKEEDLKAIVLHEFGHALGFIHEHQSPAAGISWDKEKVYAYYAEEPCYWTRDMVDRNIFQRFSKTSTNYSDYDPLSIMHYHIPPELTTDGKGTPDNVDFSVTDKIYARLLYPFPPTPENAYGILRTGDDCDEIVFKVEYNAVAKEEIEFILILGADRGREVSWWKQIGIPLTRNREEKLWVQNHSLIPEENRKNVSMRLPVSEIDNTRGITFWKAKLLGIQTLLNYKWKVWEALPGGTRITLSWNRDSCN